MEENLTSVLSSHPFLSLRSLIASVLPDTSNPNSSSVNPEGVPLSVACLRSLANVAAMDVKRFQILCKGEVNKGWEGGGGYLEFNYVCNVILSAPLDAPVEECLKWCVVLIGLYVVCNPNNQQRLHWGGGGEGQTLLSKLSSMPFQYFCDPSKKEVLFPTLIVACLDNETNKAAIEEDLNPELLACFLREKMRAVESGGEGEEEEREEWMKAVQCSKR